MAEILKEVIGIRASTVEEDRFAAGVRGEVGGDVIDVLAAICGVSEHEPEGGGRVVRGDFGEGQGGEILLVIRELLEMGVSGFDLC